jgi:hypothetical protein
MAMLLVVARLPDFNRLVPAGNKWRTRRGTAFANANKECIARWLGCFKCSENLKMRAMMAVAKKVPHLKDYLQGQFWACGFSWLLSFISFVRARKDRMHWTESLQHQGKVEEHHRHHLREHHDEIGRDYLS